MDVVGLGHVIEGCKRASEMRSAWNTRWPRSSCVTWPPGNRAGRLALEEGLSLAATRGACPSRIELGASSHGPHGPTLRTPGGSTRNRISPTCRHRPSRQA
jgi:hypothetical protein